MKRTLKIIKSANFFGGMGGYGKTILWLFIVILALLYCLLFSIAIHVISYNKLDLIESNLFLIFVLPIYSIRLFTNPIFTFNHRNKKSNNDYKYFNLF